MEPNYLEDTVGKRNPGILLALSIIIWVSLACNMLTDTGRPASATIPNDQPGGGPTRNVIPTKIIATVPETNNSESKPSETPQIDQSTTTVFIKPVVNEIKVIGGWYGPACDEEEGTFIYRWSVDLMEDPSSGNFIGTAKFHDCPGGGRASYYLTGEPQTGNIINLVGEKTDNGGGDLFGSAAQTIDFTFDLKTGKLTPNLSP